MARVRMGGGAGGSDSPCRTADRALGGGAVAGLHCVGCGSDEVIAVEPGTESERVAGIVVRRGRPVRAWCAKCWRRRFVDK